MRYRNENAFDELIAAASQRYGIPAWVLKATIATESSFDPSAFNANDPGGSRGLMQLIPATARGLGYQGAIGNDATRDGGLYLPGISVELGAKLLRELRDQFPSAPWDGIYAAYNGGPRKLTEARAPGADYSNATAVNRWRDQADYFYPAWRSGDPFPTPAAAGSRGSDPSPPADSPLCNGSRSASSPGRSTEGGSEAMEHYAAKVSYEVIDAGEQESAGDVRAQLNALGAEGWTVCGCTADLIILQRHTGVQALTISEIGERQQELHRQAALAAGRPGILRS